MIKIRSRCTYLIVLVASAFLCVQVHAQQVVELDIASQPLSEALRELGTVSDTNIIFEPAMVKGVVAPALKGSITREAALTRLLTGTKWSFKFVDENTVSLVPRDSKAAAAPASSNISSDFQSPFSRIGEGTGKEYRLAQADTSSSSSAQTSQIASEEAGNSKIEEVLVTAQKREQRLQDVPVSVTAVSADTLLNTGQLRLQDYYSSVPSLNLISGGKGDVVLSIRGVTTGGRGTNPTVGVTVDDVPYGSSTGLAGGAISFPDIDPSNLAQIEVLRGPQGTLYGASSIGGVLKFVTVDPSTDRVSGRVQADLNSIHNGDDLGYGVRAAVNLPLSDTVAVRASGFSRRDPGYVDDPVLDKEGVNRTDVEGGQFSALWRPSEAFSLKLSALLQDATGHGSSNVNTLDDLEQNFLRETGKYEQDVSVYSATLNAKLGSTDLTAITGYSISKFNQVSDSSLGSVAQLIYGVSGAGAALDLKSDKFTQEVRWSSTRGQSLEWLVGLFYTDEDSPARFLSFAADPATGASAGVLFDDLFPTTFAEFAGFGALTWHITDRFNLQLGGRQSQNKQSYHETIFGPAWELFGFPNPTIEPTTHTNDNAFTFLVTPQFRLSSELMTYVRAASGYRPGGPNPTNQVFDLPPTFKPDKTVSYELGLKGTAFDRRLSFDTSLYYIDWKDIILQVANCCAAFYVNASRAKSQGVELSAEVSPLKGLNISGWVALNEAVLTDDFPPDSIAIGGSGDRLPYSSKFSGNLSVEKEFPFVNQTTGFFGGSISYVGKRDERFSTSPQQMRFVLPSYTKIDVRTSVRFESWMVGLLLNNATDERGAIGSATASGIAGTFIATTYIQPRTISLSVSKTF